ncbi:hypothetical protein NE237_018522 [Protea cynaroides]|uniref:Uncharacterized protein n=1 Tax=Protea cynaroides TaxID=273540 RepID=A0A9Q0QP35_9MAGN|nr:hypothetical protein NE237_018522 [Protea cynaroides]
MQRERRDLQRRWELQKEREGRKYHTRARKKRYAEREKKFPKEMGVAEGAKDLQRGLGFWFRGTRLYRIQILSCGPTACHGPDFNRSTPQCIGRRPDCTQLPWIDDRR